MRLLWTDNFLAMNIDIVGKIGMWQGNTASSLAEMLRGAAVT